MSKFIKPGTDKLFVNKRARMKITLWFVLILSMV